jgi:hypothetical protein
MREFSPLEREGGIEGQLRRLPRSADRASRRDRAARFPRLKSGPARPSGLAIIPCRVHWRVHRRKS